MFVGLDAYALGMARLHLGRRSLIYLLTSTLALGVGDGNESRVRTGVIIPKISALPATPESSMHI